MSDAEYEIEKNIPVPKRSWGLPKVLQKMEVGDSILLSSKNLAAARSTLSRLARKSGMTFCTRAEGDGIRIWRTA